jgi:transcriptional regulator with XRE-family HTH domain
MTEGNEQSLIEEYEATDEGAQGLAAADLAAQVVRLLHAALEESGLDQKALASKIGVSEGRISQVLNSDGNLRIAAVARYLRALGYTASISAEPVEPGGKQLPGRTRGRGRGRGQTEAEEFWDKVGVYTAIITTTHMPHEQFVGAPAPLWPQPPRDLLKSVAESSRGISISLNDLLSNLGGPVLHWHGREDVPAGWSTYRPTDETSGLRK